MGLMNNKNAFYYCQLCLMLIICKLPANPFKNVGNDLKLIYLELQVTGGRLFEVTIKKTQPKEKMSIDTFALILSLSCRLFPSNARYSSVVKIGVPFGPLVVEKL